MIKVTEIKQHVVKMNKSGAIKIMEHELNKEYSKVFEGKKSILLLDDPVKLSHVSF